MSALELGKRYERLMMSSAPLAIAAAFLLFTSVASKDKNNSNLATCYELASSAVALKKSELQKEWDTYEEYSKRIPNFPNVYTLTLRLSWANRIDAETFARCEAVTTEIEKSGNLAPDVLEQRWAAESRKLANAPVVAHGISIESETQVTIVGTKVKVQITSLVTALQFALGPLLVLWLGSLYQTRFRESIYNSRARSLVEVYPHLINVYPLFSEISLRKRVKLFLFMRPKSLAAILFTGIRIFYVAVILSPTVALYIWSLFLIPVHSQTFAHFILGGLVALFALGVMVVELLPWHWSKVFPNVLTAD